MTTTDTAAMKLPSIKPWAERMREHFDGGNVRIRVSSHFMEEEIAELRADRAAMAERLAMYEHRPTDISQRLRATAETPAAMMHHYSQIMRQAADECERFYGGMMNWKEGAQKKDQIIASDYVHKSKIATRPSPPAPVNSVGEDSRESFEAHMKSVFGADEDFSQDRYGRYVIESWQDAYVGWIECGAMLAARTVADAPAEQGDEWIVSRDDAFDEVMKERDSAIDVADDLAAKIGEITGKEIGEHSNLNCPWANAIEFADEFIATPVGADQPAHDVRDAERYRWLRDNWFTMTSNYKTVITFSTGQPRWSEITEQQLDAAIDAAIRALRSQPAQKGGE